MVFTSGQQVGGLQIEKELGKGAFGVVYLARDLLLGRRVALKVLPFAGRDQPEERREQVLAEARLIGNLNSPHIVTLYRLHVGADQGWMQEMEFVEGGTLEDLLKRGAPIDTERALQIFRGLCLGLRTAHAARIVHGDIKPGNLLFDGEGRVKIADFGLARLLVGAKSSVELEGCMVGTPHFMSPEVLLGQSTSMAADVWAAGVVLYRLLAGRLPFDAETLGQLVQQVLQAEPAPLGPGVPPILARVVSRCLAKEVDARPATAADLIEELADLATSDRRLAPVAAPPPRATNVEAAATSFVGRDREIEEIGRLLLADGARLLTLMGPGGVGKTRISRQICRALVDRFEGGTWFAALDEAHDADHIAASVARALDLPLEGKEDPSRQMAAVLRYRKPMLLVLDNFEQVTEHAERTVGLWMREAPQVSFLVTSRALLSLPGERSYELPPLSLPPPGAAWKAASSFAGIQLFVDRAKEANPSFQLEGANAGDVLRICSELEGMPLAIELAAARANILSPQQIASRLVQKFQLLKSVRKDLAARQRTLTAAIEWSYDLLDPPERAAYLQACCFRDGFTVEAAESVLALPVGDEAPMAMDVVQSLREKSLLTARDTGLETRLGMYRAIREFGERRWKELAGSEEQHSLGRRHASFYVGYVEEWDARIPGQRAAEAMDRIALEADNVEAAQDWAQQAGEPDLAVRLALGASQTMRVRHPPRRLITMLEGALAALPGGASEAGARVRTALSAACQLAGDWDRAAECAESALAQAEAAGAQAPLARALLRCGEMHRNRGRPAEALKCFDRALAIAQSISHPHLRALSTGDRGMVLGERGEMDHALACFVSAERLAREVGDDAAVALHVGNRGVVLESRGDLLGALACHREAEDIGRRIGDLHRVATSLSNGANVLAQKGDTEGALRRYRESEAIAREMGAKQRVSHITGNRGSVHAMRGELEEALACYEEAEGISRELGDQRRIAITVSQRGNIHARKGEAPKALECFREAESIGEALGDRHLRARNLCLRGAFLKDLGRAEEAWEPLRAGIEIYDQMHANRSAWYFSFKAALVDLAFARGDASLAERLLREALNLARELGFGADHPDEGIRRGLAALRSLAPPDQDVP